MSRTRVVITGLGVVAPNANNVPDFERALREGRSGIGHVAKLQELKFGCQVAGVVKGHEPLADQTFDAEERMGMNNSMIYTSLAALEAWESAGLERPDPQDDRVDWDSGAVIGTGIGGLDVVGERVVPLTDAGKVRRLGSTCVERIMSSSVSAKVGGLLGLGNQVTTNSSACITGTEAVVLAAERIRGGYARRMLAGGSEGDSHYIWAGFDAMRVLSRKFNDRPEQASRPMSASAGGFVPGCGAGILLLESLDSALERGAPIYAELAGGAMNCGGQRMGGSMTAPNPVGVQRCVRATLEDAGIDGAAVGLINGHLTATFADPLEIRNWSEALNRGPDDFPWVTATKSMIGHCLGAAGAIESVASVLMLKHGFVHGSLNSEDLNSDLEPYRGAIPEHGVDVGEDALEYVIKAGFGFGDVNGCVLFRRWREGASA
ncbi:MAG: beta-ketoacyl-[acyl-carrier-protein] synthase family protein [bacterium]